MSSEDHIRDLNMADSSLDDLLSPEDESGPPLVDPCVDSESLDTFLTGLQPGHPTPQNSVTPGLEDISEAKSVENMESILLETSAMEESIDLGNSVATEDPALQTDQDATSLTSENLLDTSVTLESNDIGLDQEPDMVSTPERKSSDPDVSSSTATQAEKPDETKADITKYFQDTSTESESVDIFDSLVTSTQDMNVNDDGELREEDVLDSLRSAEEIRVRVHLESHSSVSEEATPVDFEEERGELPLKVTPSTRSLTKFFNSENAEGDARSFFDNFTAEIDESGGLSCSPRPSGSAFPAVEKNTSNITDTGMVLPPETPPIPSSSPMPSPFHQMSAPPSATDSKTFFSDQGSRSSETDSQKLSLTQNVSEVLSSPSQFSLDEADDPFTLGLNISDIDRRHDAWIPSEITRQVLITIMTSPPGSVVLQPDQMTMPGILLDDPQGDPVRDLVLKFMGEQEAIKRTCFTADSVPQDETGLRNLIKSECFRSAIDLTVRLLTQCGQGVGKVNMLTKHTPYTLQLWFCRLALLIRLRLFSHAETELHGFGNLDKPDLYYEFYQDKYAGRRGSMVPFGLRLLHAELPQHLGKTQESLDRLYYIHAIIKKIINNLDSGLAEDGNILTLSAESRKASKELWESREKQVLYSTANCLMAIKDYGTVLDLFDDLLQRDNKKETILLCAIARVYLQMGDIGTAQKYFSEAEKRTSPDNPKFESQRFMNKGFISLGQSHFQEAYNNFEKAIELDGNNTVAVNNMAVCALYTGQLNKALDTLENLVKEDPQRYLQEGTLFNLCTLYELESSRAIARKQQLLTMVSQHKGNGFNAACLKMV